MRAVRGKRDKPGAAAFLANLEKELLRLERELHNGTYRPGRNRTIEIFDPKHRIVSAAPFRDRVVHHALCAVCAPLFERGFIHDSYANRKGQGTHRAVARYEKFRDRFRHVLRCDIYRYFPAIDHTILKRDLRRRIACPRTLALADRIVDASNPQEPVHLHFPGDDLFAPFQRRRGLPIGNLTSQVFANVYLDGLDHFCKEVLRARGYLRYVDDFRAVPRRCRATRAVAGPSLRVPGRPAFAASSGQDTNRAHRRAGNLPRLRSPARRPAPAAGGQCPALPQPTARPARPLARRKGRARRGRTADRRLGRPCRTCRHLAPAPGDLPGRPVRSVPGTWPPPCQRVLRGGSWNNKPGNLRAANRNRNTAGNRNNNNGFRVARTLDGRSRCPYGAIGRAAERPGAVMTSRGPAPFLPCSRRGEAPGRPGARGLPRLPFPAGSARECAAPLDNGRGR